MIGNAVALNASVFQSTEQDRVDAIFDRFSGKGLFSTEDLVASIENERVDASSISTTTLVTGSTETDTKSSNHDAEDTANDRRTVYTETFLESCAELASHGHSEDREDREERRAATWFSRLRRRCSTVRDWLPTMCSCLEGSAAFVGNYQRLGDKSNALEFDRAADGTKGNGGGNRVNDNDDDNDNDDEVEELRFYTDDLSWNNLHVQKNLRTDDACDLLKIKRKVSGVDWSIVEKWPDLGIERWLEDHEDVLAVYKDMQSHPSQYIRRLHFRLDLLKYEFFFDPEQFYPNEMVDFPTAFADDEGTLTDAETALTNYLQRDDGECPHVFSLVWIRIDRLDVWRRTHMLLRDQRLYLARKTSVISLKRLPDNEHKLIPFANLPDYWIYKIANAKKRLKAPFDWGISLRPSLNAGVNITSSVHGESGFKTVVFHSEKSRVCWLTAMRLAKYGKQLRENYRAFKNKQCEQGGDGRKGRYVNCNVSNESARSRVAMDFTGSVGRIVEDPQEAKNIAESEGVNWRRTWRPFSRTPPGCAVVRLHGLDDGIHVLQPWFHRDLKRDVAAAIVRDHGSVDGVFLVRESKSHLGAYVLTYKFSDKVFHAQIQPVYDERCNSWLYTLDKGTTKFYDLLQLIEFYQLNAGCLPTRLTRYVQNGVPCAVPRPEDGGASPSPPELPHRFSNVANVVSVVNVATPAGHRSI